MHVMLVTWSTVLLVAFSVLAMADGVFVHLAYLRLHARPSSWLEHLWHTASSVLFVPILVTVFLAPSAGITLWVGISLLVLLHVVEALDVQAERSSRVDLGGVSRGELALHVGAFSSRTIATLLALASRPAAAWSLSSPPVIGAHHEWVTTLVGALVPGSIAVAALHLWLAWRHRPAVVSLAPQS